MGLGLVSLIGHVAALAGADVSPLFRNLAAVQQRMGKVQGTLFHAVRYVVLPLAFGIVLLAR